MTVTKSYNFVSSDHYLETDNLSSITSEPQYEDIYQVNETNDSQETICVNLISLLKNKLRGMGYRLYTNPMKIKLERKNIYYYSDLIITQDERDRNYSFFKAYPTLIMEILSPETEGFYRGDKFADYRTIETLKEYVLINPKQMRVECFRRNSDGYWVLYPYSEGEDVYFASIDFRVPIIAIYEDVLEDLKPESHGVQNTRSQPSKKMIVNQPTVSDIKPSLPKNHAPSSPNKFIRSHNFRPMNLLNFSVLLLVLTGVALLSYSQYQSLKTPATSMASQPRLSENPTPQTPAKSLKSNVLRVPFPPSQTKEAKPLEEQPGESVQPQESNSVLEMEKLGQSEAKAVIALVNKMQQGFYLKTGGFASKWQELGFNEQLTNEDYEYKIFSPNEEITIINATAKKPELKSYTGFVFGEGESLREKICESSTPSNLSSEIPKLDEQNIQCPNGYSVVSALE